MTPIHINWIAVLVATAAQMVVGFLWYGPILGKPWLASMAKMGKKPTDMKMTASLMIWQVVGAFVSSLALAIVISIAGVSMWWGGALWGVLLFIGIGVTATLPSVGFEGRPVGLFLIHSAYQILMFGILGAVFVLWR